MLRVGKTIFSDPDDYQVSFGGTRINLVFTGDGEFKALLTLAELPNLQLLRSQESLARIAYVALPSKQVFVSFATQFNPPPMYSGFELQSGDVVFHSRGERMHQRTSGASGWAFISLAPTYLAKYGKALTDTKVVPPRAGRVLRPPRSATAQLYRLHAKACRLAETKPDVISHAEVARALEQDLFYALINCLTADDAQEQTATRTHHASIVVRFEELLASQSDRQLNMPELCTAIGVPERTLRACCAEILGMSPSQYARLRRLNMVRSALRRVDLEDSSIAQIAARYGFSEPGRFAVLYRTVFGETPSTTLRHPRLRVRDAASAEFA
jgi:AraC-like DNA-binding protein